MAWDDDGGSGIYVQSSTPTGNSGNKINQSLSAIRAAIKKTPFNTLERTKRATSLMSGLLMWYRSAITDSSGNGHTLTPDAAQLDVGPDGFADTAMKVNNGDTGAHNNSLSLGTLPARTFACWFRIVTPTNNPNYFLLLVSADGQFGIGSHGNDTVRVDIGNDDWQEFNADNGETSDGEWHHFLVTGDSAVPQSQRGYLDGARIDTGTTTMAASTTPFFGVELLNQVTCDYVLMQHAAVWNRVLDGGGVAVGQPAAEGSEVAWLYNGGEPFDPTFDPDDIAFIEFPVDATTGIFLPNQSPTEESGRNLVRALKTFANNPVIQGGVDIAASDQDNVPIISGASIQQKISGIVQFSTLRAAYVLFDHFADASSTSTNGTENDLYSDSIPGSTFSSDGVSVFADYGFSVVSHATATRRIQAYLAGTKVLDSGTLTYATTGHAGIKITAIRESASILRVKAEFIAAGVTLQPIVTYTKITGLTLTNSQIIKVTGIAAATGAASGDIKAVMATITRFGAP